jgi:hypothetical protein
VPNISISKKEDVLAEVFKLLSEQELSLRRILTTGENCECALRASGSMTCWNNLGGARITLRLALEL